MRTLYEFSTQELEALGLEASFSMSSIVSLDNTPVPELEVHLKRGKSKTEIYRYKKIDENTLRLNKPACFTLLYHFDEDKITVEEDHVSYTYREWLYLPTTVGSVKTTPVEVWLHVYCLIQHKLLKGELK